jgi:hypothetical protein
VAAVVAVMETLVAAVLWRTKTTSLLRPAVLTALSLVMAGQGYILFAAQRKLVVLRTSAILR